MQKKMSVGSELDSYCGKCKLLLNHVVTAMVDGDPRRVRCLTCQSEHNHRLPKAKSSTTRKKREPRSSAAKAASSSTRAATRWSAAMAATSSDSRKYSIYEVFQANDVVDHATFGKGVVIEVLGPDRIITLFEDGEKMLMQGRKRL